MTFCLIIPAKHVILSTNNNWLRQNWSNEWKVNHNHSLFIFASRLDNCHLELSQRIWYYCIDVNAKKRLEIHKILQRDKLQEIYQYDQTIYHSYSNHSKSKWRKITVSRRFLIPFGLSSTWETLIKPQPKNRVLGLRERYKNKNSWSLLNCSRPIMKTFIVLVQITLAMSRELIQ